MQLIIVDAFADRPFSGNPAAVCLLREQVDSAWMQSLAAEMNLSETAFVRPVDGDFELRPSKSSRAISPFDFTPRAVY